MARWQFVAGAAPSVSDAVELTRAKQRQVTFSLNDSPQAQFTIDGRSTEAAVIQELSWDLVIYRNGTNLYRGRISGSQDEIDENHHSISFTSRGYRELLTRRILLTDTIFFGVDQSTIAWTLINTVQSRTNGNMGITRGTGQSTGVTRNANYPIGTTVAQIIGDLGLLDQGFDWEIDPNLAFNVYYPQRGSSNGTVLHYGSNVRHVQRSLQPQYFANVIVAQGNNASTTPATATSGTIASDVRGRWESNVSATDIASQSALNAYATKQLATSNTVLSSYTITMEDNIWGGPSDFWLGDTVKLVVNSGRLAVNANYRVSEIQVSLDENNTESVQATMALAV